MDTTLLASYAIQEKGRLFGTLPVPVNDDDIAVAQMRHRDSPLVVLSVVFCFHSPLPCPRVIQSRKSL
jgi:hypothetical protein